MDIRQNLDTRKRLEKLHDKIIQYSNNSSLGPTAEEFVVMQEEVNSIRETLRQDFQQNAKKAMEDFAGELATKFVPTNDINVFMSLVTDLTVLNEVDSDLRKLSSEIV